MSEPEEQLQELREGDSNRHYSSVAAADHSHNSCFRYSPDAAAAEERKNEETEAGAAAAEKQEVLLSEGTEGAPVTSLGF